MGVALLRVVSRSVVVAVLAVGLWLGAVGRVRADPLNPLDFPSLGAFPTAPGGYTIDTGGTPTLTGPGGTFTGVVSHGVAVFDFNAINVVTGQVINGTGPLPAALLSRDGITISGGINFSGGNAPSPGGSPGPGGFTSGGGPGGGGAGGAAFVPPSPSSGTVDLFGGGGGGGFGGTGGAGGSVGPLPPPLPPAFASGGPGGGTYGNLLVQLQGGGGGGTSGAGGSFGPGFGGPGGGGGGAIELGAIDKVSISGSILADGLGGIPVAGIGGGSGGGIFLHGEGVTLTGLLSARGGGGGPGGGFFPGASAAVDVGAGGGGGGGRVTILSGPGGFAESGATIDVTGGAGGGSGAAAGGAGVLVISAVPAPASLVLLGTGVLGLLGLGGMRRRAAPA